MTATEPPDEERITRLEDQASRLQRMVDELLTRVQEEEAHERRVGPG